MTLEILRRSHKEQTSEAFDLSIGDQFRIQRKIGSDPVETLLEYVADHSSTVVSIRVEIEYTPLEE